MDARRWANLIAVERAYRAGEGLAGGGPREAYIEVAARCNLRCQMCPITVDPRYTPGSGRPGLLTPEQFERLAPVFPTLQRAHLFGLGEPMLNPHLFDYARRLSEEGVEVWTTTNATLIGPEEAERFFEAGFARVSVSIDGATRETYERIRVRASWEDVLRGLRALGEVRRRHGRPQLTLTMVGMASNLHEVPRMVELCHEVGGEALFVEVLYNWSHPQLEEVYRRETVSVLGEERVVELLAAGRRRAAELGIGFSSRLDDWDGRLLQEGGRGEGAAAGDGELVELVAIGGGAEGSADSLTVPAPASVAEAGVDPLAPSELSIPWPCSEPWSTINVNASGEVRTCCFNDTVFGRLETEPIDRIWHGDPYKRLRRAHAAGRSVGGCDACVRASRVKRSPYLLPPAVAGGGAVAAEPGEGGLDAPGEGEMVAGPLVVTGRVPHRRLRRLGVRLVREAPVAPEVFLDGHLLARVADSGLVDGDRFAIVIPVGFVSEGSHHLSLRAPAEAGGATWGERHLHLGRLGEEGDAAGTAGAAFHVDLRREERSPVLRVDGARQALHRWICGRWSTHWRGVGEVDLAPLAAGPHDIELHLQHHPPHRLRVWKLAAG